MAASADYVSILRKALHDAVRVQPRLQQIRLYPRANARAKAMPLPLESGPHIALALTKVWNSMNEPSILLP